MKMKAMKIRVQNLYLALAFFTTLNLQLTTVLAQGTAFTYQGRLNNSGSPAAGTYNLTFTLFNTNATGLPIAGPVTNGAVFVTNGLFTALVDFGPGVFTGGTNWLQIGVATNGVSSFTILTPRQQLTPTPFAIYAETAGGIPGLMVQPNAGNAPSLIGGSSLNFVASGVIGATIGGGGATNFLGHSYSNSITGDFGTVGGGVGNTASYIAMVGGGFQNAASGSDSFVGGGLGNNIYAGADYSAIVGGGQNWIGVNTVYSFIGGGLANSMLFSSSGVFSGSGEGNIIAGGEYNSMSDTNGLYIADSVISGGNANQVQGFVDTIGGGQLNLAENQYSTVGGGVGNVATGMSATVAGGGQAAVLIPGAKGVKPSVGGGTGNTASGDYSFIGGGRGNVASGYVTTIAGGDGNSAMLDDDVIGGGWGNTASDDDATVGGGDNNNAYGQASVISGGEYNSADYDHTTVVGGQGNTAGGSYAFVGGGNGNDGEGAGDTLAGGFNNSSGGGNNSTIGGGNNNNSSGSDDVIGGGQQNSVSDFFATIGGGVNNTATNDATVVAGGTNNVSGGFAASVGGGSDNAAPGNWSTVGGGWLNQASGDSATVGGGYNNYAVDSATVAGGRVNAASDYVTTVAGGLGNQSLVYGSTVGGGLNNNADGYMATIPGGASNVVSGSYAFAAGFQAQATNNNSFVWSDGSANTATTAANQFVARASGGFILFSATTGTGVSLAPGSGSWSTMSDRNAKDDFTPVNSQAVLAQVAALPLTMWSYKTEPGVRHVGPMAQDFHTAFAVGEDDRHIAEVDEDGVALAAIQGLDQKVEELKNELNRKDAENAELKQRLDRIEKLLTNNQGGDK